jgi:hypothetical protein
VQKAGDHGPLFNFPYDLVIAPADSTMYELDQCLLKIPPGIPVGGTTTEPGGGQPSQVGSSCLSGQHLAFDGSANLLVTSSAALVRSTPAGLTTTLAGISGITAVIPGTLPVSLNQPRGVVQGPNGAIYVTDENSVLVLKP